MQNVEVWEKILSSGKFSDRELDVRIVERGIVLPARKKEGKSGYEGGVCDEDFNFVAGFHRFSNPKINAWINVNSAYEIPHEDIVQLDEDVIFGGTLNGHFGHFMMENWCRLWYVVKHPELSLKILFVVAHWGYKPWFNDFFRLVGIDADRIVYVNQPTQCRSVTVPDQSEYWNSFTKKWLLPFQTIKSRIKSAEPKKLYLTRTKLAARNAHVYNEEYFEDFFAKRGFEVVSPEKLPLEEQFSLVMGADEIAATMGTLTHWALFCKPTAKFIMFPRTTDDEGHFQRFINNVFTNYYIVDVSKNFMWTRHNVGEFLIGSTKYWKEFVADYFGEQIDEDGDSSYLNAALGKYTDSWCQRYVGANSANFNVILGSLRNMCNRIITLEREQIKRRPLLTYQTHVHKDGWVTWKSEEQISNPINQKFDIQAVKINFPDHKVHYSVYYGETEGWSQEVSDGEMAGTTGKAKSIFGIKIRLDDSGGTFDILYRVHTFDGEWTPWARNGAEILSNGVKLNALQIKLVSK